jgi:hypothetical protein
LVSVLLIVVLFNKFLRGIFHSHNNSHHNLIWVSLAKCLAKAVDKEVEDFHSQVEVFHSPAVGKVDFRSRAVDKVEVANKILPSSSPSRN